MTWPATIIDMHISIKRLSTVLTSRCAHATIEARLAAAQPAATAGGIRREQIIGADHEHVGNTRCCGEARDEH
jgi:hypothetical protein